MTEHARRLGYVNHPLMVYVDSMIGFEFRTEDALVRFTYAAQTLALPEDARVFRVGETYLITRESIGRAQGLRLVTGSWEK